MRRDSTSHSFEVPMTEATISMEDGKVKGHLEATGHYLQEWNVSRTFDGTNRGKGKRSIADIAGLFGTDSDADLGNPLGVYTLCFPLLGEDASARIRCEATEEAGIWNIRAA